MREIFEIVIFLIFIAAVSSCKYDQIPVSEDAGFIRGDVVDAITSPTIIDYMPVGEARVTTYPATSEVYSYPDGAFYIRNVPPGSYLIIAEKPGYYNNYRTARVSSRRETPVGYIVLHRVVEGNNPPTMPSTPFPVSGYQVLMGDYLMLSWFSSDPDENDLVFFDVYLDTLRPPVKRIVSEITKTNFETAALELNRTYYWRVIAYDLWGASTLGEIWNFTTR